MEKRLTGEKVSEYMKGIAEKLGAENIGICVWDVAQIIDSPSGYKASSGWSSRNGKAAKATRYFVPVSITSESNPNTNHCVLNEVEIIEKDGREVGLWYVYDSLGIYNKKIKNDKLHPLLSEISKGLNSITSLHEIIYKQLNTKHQSNSGLCGHYLLMYFALRATDLLLSARTDKPPTTPEVLMQSNRLSKDQRVVLRCIRLIGEIDKTHK
jgi:hypothetical protein